MKIIERTNEPLDEIISFYEAQGYNGGATEEDQIFLCYLKEELICVVRFAFEENVPVLRGMFMEESFRGKGLGKKILKFLVPIMDGYNSDCYCIPKGHLEEFYNLAGFERIETAQAPGFLIKRINRYIDNGQDVFMMRRALK